MSTETLCSQPQPKSMALYGSETETAQLALAMQSMIALSGQSQLATSDAVKKTAESIQSFMEEMRKNQQMWAAKLAMANTEISDLKRQLAEQEKVHRAEMKALNDKIEASNTLTANLNATYSRSQSQIAELKQQYSQHTHQCYEERWNNCHRTLIQFGSYKTVTGVPLT